MLYQRTLAKEAQVTGIGLHSGKKVTLKLYPAKADSGIIFRRIDLENAPELKAVAQNIGATENATTLGSGSNVIHTVEHLLSVLYAFGIDNIYCEVDGPEIPIMDGSGGAFVFLLKEAGLCTLSAPKKFLMVLRPVRVEMDDKWAEIAPAPKLMVDSTIIFAHPKIKTQRKIFNFSCEQFINEICRARTFVLLKEVDGLKRRGLAKGGSLDNVVVLDEFSVMNDDGTRFSDEFVRHKILDTIGDLSLLGHELVGRVTTYKSGHNLHAKLCQKILSDPTCYKIVDADELLPETLEAFDLSLVLGHSFS